MEAVVAGAMITAATTMEAGAPETMAAAKAARAKTIVVATTMPDGTMTVRTTGRMIAVAVQTTAQEPATKPMIGQGRGPVAPMIS
jgi:hypothetical protein